MMTANERVLDEIRRMSVADLVDLVRALESEIAHRADTTAAAATTGAGVSLRDFGADPIAIIKAVRELTDLGLREARSLTDAVDRDHDGGPEGVGLPAKPKGPLPSGENSERIAAAVRSRRAA